VKWTTVRARPGLSDRLELRPFNKALIPLAPGVVPIAIFCHSSSQSFASLRGGAFLRRRSPQSLVARRGRDGFSKPDPFLPPLFALLPLGGVEFSGEMSLFIPPTSLPRGIDLLGFPSRRPRSTCSISKFRTDVPPAGTTIAYVFPRSDDNILLRLLLFCIPSRDNVFHCHLYTTHASPLP